MSDTDKTRLSIAGVPITGVVFIDSRVPDLQALIAGVQPGELVFVLAPGSDGVQQIADVLAANNLGGLASIAIVGHGSSGEIGLGATQLDDADLAGHAAALATIGAALAPGGDLALYACNTAAGAAGQQFIADLSHYAGGVDVAAATHLVGDASHGGSWTLDAATAAPVASAAAPFTAATLASFQGELTGTIDGQIWFGGSSNGDGVAADNQIGYVNSDGTGKTSAIADPHETGTSGNAAAYDYVAIGLDTAAGLYFGIGGNANTGTDATLDVQRIGGSGALIQSLSLNPNGLTSDYIINAIAVDPKNHVIYIGVWGDSNADTGIIKLAYNPTTGVVNNGNSLFSGSPAVIDSSYYIVTDAGGTGGAPFTNPVGFALDIANQKLYFAAQDYTSGALFGSPYPDTNGIYVLDLASKTTTLLSASSLTTDAQHTVHAIAVNAQDGVIYFSTGSFGGTTPVELWEMPIGGGTAHQMSLPTGVTLNSIPYADGLAFDPVSRELLVSETGDGSTIQSNIYALTVSANGTTLTGERVLAQLDTQSAATSTTASTTGLTFDTLATIGTLSGTTSQAVQGGAGVTLLAATPSGITDPDSGGFLASATVTVSNGQSGDLLGLNASFSYTTTPTIVTAGGGTFDVSFDATTHTLTIANTPGFENTFAEYEAILAELSFKDTGTDTSTGSHPQRTITWQVNDGAAGNPAGAGNVATTTLTIERAPVAAADTATAVAAGAAATGNVVTNDQDKDGDTLTVTGFTDGTSGSVGTLFHGTYGDFTLNANGSYSYTAGASVGQQAAIAGATTGSHPTEVISYTESDGHGGTSSSTLTVTIDRAPVLTADSNATSSGAAAATGNVLGNDGDPDGDTLSVTAFTDVGSGSVGTLFHGTYGDLTLNADGSYSYAAGATIGERSAIAAATTGSHPTEVITYTASDGFGGTSSSTLSIALDRAPTLSLTPSAVTYTAQGTAQALQSAVTIADPDGNDAIASAVVTLTGGVAGDLLSLNGSVGTVTLGDGSQYSVAYSGAGATETLTITTTSGTGTQADYQSLLNGVVFSSSATDPTGAGATPTRSASFQITDVGGQASAAAGPETVTVQLAPSISLVSAATTGGATDLDAGNVVTFTVKFTTVVNVTGAPQLQLNDSEVATYTGGSGSNTLTFSYTVQSTDNIPDLKVQSLLPNGGTIKDGAGHDAVLTNAATDLHLQVDTTAPTVSIGADHTTLSAGQTGTVTFTFSEAVASFAIADTTVTGGALSNLVHVGVNGSSQDIYTATFTPTASNAETGSVRVNAASYTDVAGNAGAASNSLSFAGDTLAPTVAVAADHTTLLAGQTATVTFTFSEQVSSFVLGDTTFAGGALSDLVHVGLNGSNQDVYTATFTPTGSNAEAGSVQVNAASYTDVAGNAGAASNTLSLSGDTLAPTVAVSADHTALSAGQTALVTFTFSEAVSGFAIADVAVAGGALSNLTHVGLNGASQDIYTATFTPTASNAEAGSVQVDGASYTDVAGNAGAASNTLSLSGDTLAPTVAIGADHTALLAGQTATVTFTFSEAVSSFVLGDTTVAGGALSNLVHVGLNGSSQDVYTATFTPTVSNTEAGSVQVNATSYTDVAGNAGAASNTLSFSGDTLAPTVAVSADHTTLSAGQTATVTFTFSEAVVSFVLGDATVVGGALSNLVHVGLNGSSQDVYTATFTPTASNAEAGSVQVNAASYADAAGNTGAASNTLGFAGDTLAPTVAVSADHTALLAGQTALVTFTFSEAVSGFAFADVAVAGGALSNLTHVGINGSSQDIYTATFTPTASNAEAGSVQVDAASYTDAAANAGAASNTLDFSGDTLVPHLVAVTAAPSSGTEGPGRPVTITLAFDEAVSLTGGTPTLALNDGGTATYDATATAALHDATKLVFDDTVATTDTATSALAVTGIDLHGAAVADLAGNPAALNNAVVATTFTGLGVDPTIHVTANPDSNHVVAGQTLTADAAHGVLANDTDSNPADHLKVTAVNGLSGAVDQPVAGADGTLTLHADGSYVYVANGTVGTAGVDNFIYTASNGHGAPSTATLSIEVIGANQTYVHVAPGGAATGGYGNTVLDGSAGGATLNAATTLGAQQVLVGGPGDTLNAANYGRDTFVFADNFGHETINNFHPALDVIQLQQSQFGNLATVFADLHQVGADSVLTLDANHVITITNIQHTSLTASDFHLV